MSKNIVFKKTNSMSKIYAALALACMSATAAHADDYGCQVLLCLANPGGPTQFAECVPPIERLWSDLLAIPPRPFPTCLMAGSDNRAGATSIVRGYCKYPRDESIRVIYETAVEVNIAGQDRRWYNFQGKRTQPYTGPSTIPDGSRCTKG